jgi:hypothetical protein
MSARDDGITGEVLDKFEALPPSGLHCSDCGRALVCEEAWVGEGGDLYCIPCTQVRGHDDE